MDRVREELRQRAAAATTPARKGVVGGSPGCTSCSVRHATAQTTRRCFSMCLQNEEDRILQAMEAYYGTQGYEVHVLIYDGCLIARKDEKPFPEVVMLGCERAVHEETGYNIKLAEKCLRCEVVCSKCRCDTHK